jgi:DNA-directed RNA polymerase specialized sigma24 family protein
MREEPADPFGEVVGRWRNLPTDERDRHSCRIVGVGVADARVERPDDRCHRHYARLLDAALADDPVALGWLAETHRPLLLTRGRLLFEQDPAEWGAASLEVLVASARFMQGDTGPWLRRQVSQQICHRMRRLVRRELARRGCERAVDPSRLPSLEPPGDPEPHPQLTVALERALGRLDDATSAGLRAVAMQLPLATVAADHDLTHAALRQRVARARRQLRPQLADFARSA